MKTREWIFVLFLVVLAQLIIHYIAFDFGSSGRALGYVSIAGTIVSIVLGLIAIIYSFVQSITQANSVSDIRLQVEKLVEVGDSISRLEQDLQKSARKVNKATRGLHDKLHEHASVTQSVAESINEIGRAFTTDDSGRRSFQSKAGGTVEPYSSQYVMLDVIHLMVIDAIELEKDLVSFHMEIVAPYAKGTDWKDNFLVGAFTAISIDLILKGVIEINNAKDSKGQDILMINRLSAFDSYMSLVKEEAKLSSADEVVQYLDFVKKLKQKH